MRYKKIIFKFPKEDVEFIKLLQTVFMFLKYNDISYNKYELPRIIECIVNYHYNEGYVIDHLSKTIVKLQLFNILFKDIKKRTKDNISNRHLIYNLKKCINKISNKFNDDNYFQHYDITLIMSDGSVLFQIYNNYHE